MLSEWTEVGLGKHYTWELVLSTSSFSEYQKIREELDIVNDIMKRHGSRFSLSEYDNGGDTILRITIFSDSMKRNAGPKRKIGKMKRVSEVFTYHESHSTRESAEFAGIALRSYQRRVKKYKEMGKWNVENQAFF